MKRTIALATLLVLAGAAGAKAQQAEQKASSANAAVMGMSQIFGVVKSNIVKSAEQVPEDKYSYQPTREVRTFGQLIGHIADAHNYFCGLIAGTATPYAGSNEKLTSKAELQAALKKSFETCDAALAKVTDADLARPIDIFGNKANLAAAVTLVTSHDWEHYGNLVTYMRLNGMVPPSSQQN
ncbi:MAG: DinB family protein [Gemmatimonadota bacterium]